MDEYSNFDTFAKYVNKNPRNGFGIVSIVALIILLTIIGFSFWIIVIFALGIIALYYLFFIRKFTIQSISWFLWIIVFSPLILSVTILSFSKSFNKNEIQSEALTPEQCKPIYDDYNGRILDVSSNGLQGMVTIEINPDDCYADLDYLFLFNENLSQNGEVHNPYWGYLGQLYSDEPRSDWSGNGEIFTVHVNKGNLPATPEDAYYFYRDDEKFNDSTDWFYHHFGIHYVFNDEGYEKLLLRNKYAVLNGYNYIVGTEQDGGISRHLDEESAAPSAPIVKEYELVYTVR